MTLWYELDMASGRTLADRIVSETRAIKKLEADYARLLEKQASERASLISRLDAQARVLSSSIEAGEEYVTDVTEAFPEDLSDAQDEFYSSWAEWSAPEITVDIENDEEPLTIYEEGDIEELVAFLRTSDNLRR